MKVGVHSWFTTLPTMRRRVIGVVTSPGSVAPTGEVVIHVQWLWFHAIFSVTAEVATTAKSGVGR